MPAKSAKQIEDAIDAAVAGIPSLSAIGLWYGVLKPNIMSSTHESHLQIDGLPGTLERLALRVKRPIDRVSRLMAHLENARRDDGRRMGLIATNGDGVVFSPAIKQLMVARSAATVRQRKSRRKRNDYDTKGVTSTLKGCDIDTKGCDTGVTEGVTPPPLSPPMVSPPITPSSFPPHSPPPTYIFAGGREIEVDSPQLRQECLRAFSQWSAVSIGRDINTLANEHKPIFDLIASLAQEPSIRRGSEMVPRHELIPLAADLAKKGGKPFKGVKFACVCITSTLEEWALKGMPGSKTEPETKPRIAGPKSGFYNT